jgi:hypothetical protein
VRHHPVKVTSNIAGKLLLYKTSAVDINANKKGVSLLDEVPLQSTDHELIPARNASLAAMQGSASGSNVRYYPT